MQDRVTNEEVRRRCGVENFEHRLRKMRPRRFGHAKHKDDNSILKESDGAQGGRSLGRPKEELE